MPAGLDDMKLSIITLNFNKPQLTLACIDSLYHQHKELFEENVFECIVVDNASYDNSVEAISKKFKNSTYKNVVLVPHTENGGFGAGNNVGVKKAKGEYIVFLNNDTIVQDDGLLKMLAYIELHKEIGILGGQLRNDDGSLQPSVGTFYTLPNVLLLLLGMQRFGILDKSPNHIEKVDWVKGGLLMMKKGVFEKLGGFDEKIFMYTEDMELCFRAKKNGYDSYFFPDVHIIHKEHGSTSRTFAIVNIYKNLPYFYKKHLTSFDLLVLLFLLKVKAYASIIFGTIVNNNYLRSTYAQALAVLR